MSDWQSEEEFRQNLNTQFRLLADAPKPLDLTLIAVESRPSEAHEEAGMERFSVFFKGSREFLLPQATYQLAHPQMGEFYVFLVPIETETDGYRYEAVYNYYQADGEKQSDQTGG
ncbi:MAG TPA: hypothetical protein VFS77_05120 [Pyrinomonadaceae bacterium]|nr:hypothetical protein [Pyrinomonadaceae bacterium]